MHRHLIEIVLIIFLMLLPPKILLFLLIFEQEFLCIPNIKFLHFLLFLILLLFKKSSTRCLM